MNRNKYKNYVLQSLISEHIVLQFYYKIVKYVLLRQKVQQFEEQNN
jgi:hypothetical protein